MGRPSKGARTMVTLRLSAPLLARIEKTRGDQDRHTAILDLLEFALAARKS